MSDCIKRGHRAFKMICKDCGKQVNEYEFKADDKKWPEWISVKNRLPLEGEELIFRTNEISSKPIFTGRWEQEGKWKVVYATNAQDCEIEFEEITHWMPLPEAPKEPYG